MTIKTLELNIIMIFVFDKNVQQIIHFSLFKNIIVVKKVIEVKNIFINDYIRLIDVDKYKSDVSRETMRS